MTERFLDTNIFLRHLLNDDPVESPACFALFQALEQGREAGWTTHLVIAELVFVLANPKTYHLSREAIRDRLLPLIGLPKLKLAQKQLYPRIFALYTSLAIDYIDCYHATLIEHRHGAELYSFDTDFDRIPSLTRHEPTAK